MAKAFTRQQRFARGYAQAQSDAQETYQAALAAAPPHGPPPRTAFLEQCEVEIYEGLTYVRLDDVMHLLSDGTPSEEQIEKAARAFFREYHGEDIWPELRDDGELDTRSRALAATRAALTAAGVAPQEPSLSNSEILERIAEQEREAAGAPAPQELNQNKTKSAQNFVSLDPEKVAAIIWDLVDVSPERQDLLARALCEAYTEGKLT